MSFSIKQSSKINNNVVETTTVTETVIDPDTLEITLVEKQVPVAPQRTNGSGGGMMVSSTKSSVEDFY